MSSIAERHSILSCHRVKTAQEYLFQLNWGYLPIKLFGGLK